jgi:uncharacterized repeat protein (TIGR02059 family)
MVMPPESPLNTTTGIVVFSKEYYQLGDIAGIAVQDPDLNTDSNNVETVIVKVKSSTTDTVGISVELTETGVNTGLFSGFVYVASASNETNSVIGAAATETIVVTYNDAANVNGNPEVVTAIATVTVENPLNQTAQPTITGTVRAGDTSISGTATTGASVVLRVNGAAQEPIIATEGNWTVSGLTLVKDDVISVTAQSDGETESTANVVIVSAPDTDTEAPVLQSATVIGNTLTITFSESLDNNSIPSAADFSVAHNGLTKSVGNVSISDSSVTLTLPSVVIAGDTVNVSYTYTIGTNPVQDLACNPILNLINQTVEVVSVT